MLREQSSYFWKNITGADQEYRGKGVHGVWGQTLRIFNTVYLEDIFKVFGKT